MQNPILFKPSFVVGKPVLHCFQVFPPFIEPCEQSKSTDTASTYFMNAPYDDSKIFTADYNVTKLVYFERFDFVDLAIAREKQIKKYSKIKKAELVNKMNPHWTELYKEGKVMAPSQ